MVGWAAQPAQCLVPVPGVRFDCDQTLRADDAKRAVAIPAGDVRALQLSDGLWRSLPEHRARLLSAVRTQHVMVAESTGFETFAAEREFSKLAGTIDCLELRIPRPGWIHIEFAVV